MSYDQLFNRMPRKLAFGLSFVLPVALLISSAGCKTGAEDDNPTNAYVQIVSVTGTDFTDAGEGDTGPDLFSDVCFANEDFPPCTVFNDNVNVTLIAFPKDATQTNSLATSIVFDRYRVTYIRADGRNVPGVDVPYPFDGVANFSVATDGTEVSRSFIVVRHQAKRESPLRELSFGGSILSVIAQIDLYGRDINGRPVQVTGYLNIVFADFGND